MSFYKKYKCKIIWRYLIILLHRSSGYVLSTKWSDHLLIRSSHQLVVRSTHLIWSSHLVVAFCCLNQVISFSSNSLLVSGLTTWPSRLSVRSVRWSSCWINGRLGGHLIEWTFASTLSLTKFYNMVLKCKK